MQEKKDVLILFGGVSSEHDISRLSTESVLNHINRDKYNIFTIGITKDGRWLLTDAAPEQIADGTWENVPGNRRASISPDRAIHGMVVEEMDGSFMDKHIDVIIPVMHGQNAEDGTLQGLLQLSGIPFVGSGTTSSAASMDKAITKAMVKQDGRVAQARCYVSNRNKFEADRAAEMRRINDFFEDSFPLFVKPANAGSSVGISKVKSADTLEKALEIAFEIDSKVLIEETIVGREIEVAVLGNEDAAASSIGEIFAANEFYDYNAKYENAASRTEIVRDLPEALEEKIKEAALAVYNIMGCRGLARIDFFLEEGGRVVLNELNTLPGFTQISMYPQLWQDSGIPYDELIDRLIELALEEKPYM